MNEKCRKRGTLRIAGIAILVVIVLMIVPQLILWIVMLGHREPYTEVESYEKLKEMCEERQDFIFPDILLKKVIIV